MGDEFDFGNLGFDDSIDFSGLNLGNLDLSGLSDLNLGDVYNIDTEDLNLGDLRNLSLDDIGDLSAANLTHSDMQQLLQNANQDLSGLGDLQGGGQLGNSGIDESFLKNLSPTELEQYKRMQETGADNGLTGDQSQFANQDLSKLWQADYDKQWEANKDKTMTSQWQKMADGRYAMVQEDGSAIGIDQDGNNFALSPSQVEARIKSGDLNTFNSGYNTATGGNKIAPGGGKMTVDANGNKTWTMPNGNTITQKPDGTTTEKTPTGKTTTTSPSGQQTTSAQNDWMKYLMMLMALDAMRNKGDSNQAVIPRLSGERTQTPYAAIQQAAGYRPGQGGIKYFSDVTHKAAGGGIGSLAGVGSVDSAGGRLLRGPGDGVSDSIKAQIGDNQPARLADGEYVLDARTVSEIGNGSTEAGAKKLAAMVSRIQQSRRHAKRGKPSNADKHLLA